MTRSLFRYALHLVLSVALLSFLPRPARAQDAVDTLSAEQRKLVDEGLQLRSEDKDREALERFEAARRLGDDPQIRAQLAFAAQALGRWVQSYEHLRAALDSQGNPWIESKRELLEAELDSISKNVGHLEVHVNVAGAVVKLDDVERGTTPLTAPLIALPGSVTVSVQAEGYLPRMRQVMVRGGGLSRVELELIALPKVEEIERAKLEPAFETRTKLRHDWLYGVGSGVLVAVTATVPWAMGERELDTMRKACPSAADCDLPNGSVRRVERTDRATNALLFGGLGIAASAALVYVLWPEEYRVPVAVLPTPLGVSAAATLRY